MPPLCPGRSIFATKIMLRLIVVAVFALLCAVQAAKAQEGFCVMELNAENLFDPIDDPAKDDDVFLPTAVRRWTWRRLMRKLDNVGKTVAACGGNALPDIVALCEVENDTVMWRLVRASVLRRGGYDYFLGSGDDERGINVAMLYRSVSFKPFFHESLHPDFRGLPAKRTRDVLHVSGRIVTGDTLDVFVCHMPSKIDPHKEGRPYRERIGTMLRRKSDSICRARKAPNVIITGDFNDGPQSATLARALGAAPLTHGLMPCGQCLYSLVGRESGTGRIRGTYYYQGFWELLDNMVVNGRMLSSRSGIYLPEGGCRIFCAPFLLVERDGELIPWHTYDGMRYSGGFSDHLPIVAHFNLSFGDEP